MKIVLGLVGAVVFAAIAFGVFHFTNMEIVDWMQWVIVGVAALLGFSIFQVIYAKMANR